MAVLLSIAILVTSQMHGGPDPVERVDCPKQVILPMIQDGEHSAMIKLSIGGKEYSFVLDTGATGGRISTDVVERLGLKPVAKVLAGDPSGKNSREVSIYRIPEIKAGDATLYGVQMFADNGPRPKNSKMYFDGVIGYAVFRSILLTLDYPHQRIILTPGGMTAAQLRKSIPYKTEHGIPLLPIQIGKVKVNGHLDSGADGGLSIPSKFQGMLNVDGKPRLVGHAKTLFNTIDIYAVKVKDPVLVGGIKMPINQIELNNLLPFGNIGVRLMSKFRVSIDQKQHRVVFE